MSTVPALGFVPCRKTVFFDFNNIMMMQLKRTVENRRVAWPVERLCGAKILLGTCTSTRSSQPNTFQRHASCLHAVTSGRRSAITSSGTRSLTKYIPCFILGELEVFVPECYKANMRFRLCIPKSVLHTFLNL